MEESGVKIRRLDNQEDWSRWKPEMLALMRMKGLSGIIDGTVTEPGSLAATATSNERLEHAKLVERFDKQDGAAVFLILNSCTENVSQVIRDIRQGHQMWLALLNIFEQRSGTRIDRLYLELFSCKEKPSDVSIVQHISQLRNIVCRLDEEIYALDGVRLPKSVLLYRILSTLPSEYFEFKNLWESRPYTERTVELLTAELRNVELRLQDTSANVSSFTNNSDAFVTMKTNERKVYSKNANSKTGKKKDFSKIKCYKCHEFGHYQNKCMKGTHDQVSANVSVATGEAGCSGLVATAMIHEETSEDSWWCDSGATDHITRHRNYFSTFKKFDKVRYVKVGNNELLEAHGCGQINVEVLINGKWIPNFLVDVWYVPNVCMNLFSQLIMEDRGFVFHYENRHLNVTKNGEVCVTASRRGRQLYKMNYRVVQPEVTVGAYLTKAVKPKSDMLQIWHERLSHQNKRHVQKFLKLQGIEVSLDSEFCEACAYGKSHRLPFKSRAIRATKPAEIIHTDVCGPFPVESLGKKRYYVSFRCDYTRMTAVYFIARKSDVAACLDEFLKTVKSTTDHKVCVLQSDNGGEFDNDEVRKILNGIEHRLVMPRTPEQNGCAERLNRTLVEAGVTMLFAGDFPQKLWAEAVHTAAYVINRTGPSSVEGTTPYELWYGREPPINHLRIFGTECFVHISKETRKKLDRKSVKGYLVGYCGDKDGFRVYIPSTGQVQRSHDVIFKPESVLKSKFDIYLSEEQYSLMEPPQEEPPALPQEEPPNEVAEQTSLATKLITRPDDATRGAVNHSGMNLRPRATLKSPAYLDNYACAMFHSSLDEPMNFQSAIHSPDSEQWKCAMDEEMTSLAENEVWDLVMLPKGSKAIDNRWVFKVKQNAEGKPERYKARLVAKGYSQKAGIDYDETFSPVARFETIRSIFGIAATKNLKLMQFDVKTAFLYGHLTETVYMKQPEGYDDGSGRVCHLKRSLYGLKQSPRCWNKRLVDKLLLLNFEQSSADSCVFYRDCDGGKLIIVVYVDDGIAAAPVEEEIRKFMQELQAEFQLTATPVACFLGIQIEQSQDGSLFLSQEGYATRMLKKFDMYEANPVSTPSDTSRMPEGAVIPLSDEVPYRAAVGSLLYLAMGTRPDIAFAVSIVSKKLDAPTNEDWKKVKRILRYVKGTISFGIHYKPGLPSIIDTYSDADFASDPNDRKSTSGTICLFSGAAVAWMSQKQKCISLSTTEAEIIAASEATKSAVWLNRLFSPLTELEDVPIVKCDNAGAVKLAKNPEFHRRTKHIDVRHYFIREKYLDGAIRLEHVPGEFQIADALTKPLPRPRFHMLRMLMGVKMASEDEIDYSALRDPVLTSVRGMADYANCIRDGTDEVRRVLTDEVDVILECKICRKLFRSLANLIMHKRVFCRAVFKNQVRAFPAYVETVIMHTTNSNALDGVDREKSKPLPDSFLRDSYSVKSPELPLLSGPYETSQKPVENLKLEENQKPQRSINVLRLEKIDANANAVFQTIEVEEVNTGIEMLTNTTEEKSDTCDFKNTKNDSGAENEPSDVDEANWKTFCNFPTLTCNICDQNYSSMKTLKFHVLNLHGKVRTFYPCLFCKLLFCQTWSCRRHMERSHSKSRDQVLKLNEIIKKKAFTVPLDQLNEKGMPKFDPREQSNKLVVKLAKKENVKNKVKDEPSDETFVDTKPKEEKVYSEISKVVKKRVKTNDDANSASKKKAKCDILCHSPVISDDSSKSFSCYNCGREYDVKGSLNKHLHRRSCFDQFGSNETAKPLRRELRTVLNDEQLQKVNKFIDRRRMQCKRCDRKFTNVSNLNRHAVRHIGISRFKCKLCVFKCYNMGECRRHLQNTHKKNEYRKYIVDIEDESELDSGVRNDKSSVESPPDLEEEIAKRLDLEQSPESEYRTPSPPRTERKPTCAETADEKDFSMSTRNSPRRVYSSAERGRDGIATRGTRRRIHLIDNMDDSKMSKDEFDVSELDKSVVQSDETGETAVN